MRATSFRDQRATLWQHIPQCSRTCIDANGIGAQLAEEAEEYHGPAAEGVSMNGQVPAKLASKVKHLMEQGLLLIPDDPEVRRDLHQIRRTYTDAGNTRFEAPRTKDGHADRFWALALAVEAASNAPSSMVDAYRGTGPASRWMGDDQRKVRGPMRDSDEVDPKKRAAARPRMADQWDGY